MAQSPSRTIDADEADEAALPIMQQVRQLEEQGQVTIVRGDADDAFV